MTKANDSIEVLVDKITNQIKNQFFKKLVNWMMWCWISTAPR